MGPQTKWIDRYSRDRSAVDSRTIEQRFSWSCINYQICRWKGYYLKSKKKKKLLKNKFTFQKRIIFEVFTCTVIPVIVGSSRIVWTLVDNEFRCHFIIHKIKFFKRWSRCQMWVWVGTLYLKTRIWLQIIN